MATKNWHDLGSTEELRKSSVTEVFLNKKKVAITFRDGTFGAISGACNHVGGPLGQGTLDGEYVVCPWHYWKFHRVTGKGEPGFEKDCVPSYQLKEEKGHLFIQEEPATARHKSPHDPHPLSRSIERAEGPIRVAGISTTAMNAEHPRYSTSDALLEVALEHAKKDLQAETKLIKLNDLQFRTCEGYYSRAARACTWPCSITQMDSSDQLDQVYDAFVHWADVLLIGTPIRWGAASAHYYKMVERMNCIQNQITTHNKVLIKNKVAAFVITGGQDNIQAVAGQMLGFFSEIGFVFPPFSYIAHSRGWSAEDMERNIAYVQESEDLREGAKDLVVRAIETAKTLLSSEICARDLTRGGRKAQQIADR